MINGILNIYKEKGYTSHDVVGRLRGIVGQKKIGHTGTLDPAAEGVLPVCLGKATRLCDMLTDQSKTYETVLLLGKTTDTQDLTGQVLAEKDTGFLREEEVRACIGNYLGEYEQLPPMYSALKVNGKKLYELARSGIQVERKKRKVTIYEIEIRQVSLPRVRLSVHCSKGTYIRTLCHDIGAELGCGGCMESLLRTQAGRFLLQDSLKLDQIEKLAEAGRLAEALLPVDAVFEALPEIWIAPKFQELAYNGNPFSVQCTAGRAQSFRHQEQVRLYDQSRNFIGIFWYDGEKKLFRAKKMFLDNYR